jgi:hypothetical protein
VSGIYKQKHSKNNIESYKLGYLSVDEVNFADHVLDQTQSRPGTNARRTSLHKLIIGIVLCLFISVGGLIGAIEFYRQPQLQQSLPTMQAQVQNQLPKRLNSYGTLVDVRAGRTGWTFIYTVTIVKDTIHRRAFESDVQESICANDYWKKVIWDGIALYAEYWDRSGDQVGRFQVSCP